MKIVYKINLNNQFSFYRKTDKQNKNRKIKSKIINKIEHIISHNLHEHKVYYGKENRYHLNH